MHCDKADGTWQLPYPVESGERKMRVFWWSCRPADTFNFGQFRKLYFITRRRFELREHFSDCAELPS
ncbi:protein of unknown function [Candidatus Filomicrobium marinum]|uniref:Uncharacterized protein n=1 Tax=Candidatus Filomicrobium marinum TaxID=1608628 RepID=A0A0D6JEG5_9HYPH|nr:protein of unknown function [Candidatus Filomicrobium marinum]CPR17854.1 protein of unknown function [Candidatus Filomicrobium marinum]